MRAAAIKIKNYASNISDSSSLRKQIFNFLLITLGALAALYVLLLGNTVWNIVERRALEAQARTLGNEVGELELIYLSAVNKIDPAFSETLGFKEVKAKFVTRKSFEHMTASSEPLKITKNEI